MATYQVIGYNKANEKQIFHDFAESLDEARLIGCNFVIKYYTHGDAQILSESFKPLGWVVLNIRPITTTIADYLYLYLPDKKRDCYGINEITGSITKKPIGKKWW